MNRHDRNAVSRSLDEVDAALEHPVRTYMIGGGALAIRGLKDATKDLDHVVATHDDYDILFKGLTDAGFTEVPPLNLKAPYPALAARGIFEQKGRPQWDVFVGVVARKLRLSPGMIARARPAEPSRTMLKVYFIADEDILVFKSVAGRIGDKEDMERILLTRPDWQSILAEMRWQCRHWDTAWSGVFHDAMAELAERYSVPILDELAVLADQDVLDKQVLGAIRDGVVDLSALGERFPEDGDLLEEALQRLTTNGWVIGRAGRFRAGLGPPPGA